MLNNGYIKCKNNNKKTRKYTIKLDDVIDYIEDGTAHPEHYHMPDSMFSSSASKIANKYGFPKVLPTEDFKLWLSDEWSKVPDMLTNNDIVSLTGYGIIAVNRWIHNKWLKSIKTQNGAVISSEWLIDYYSSKGYNIGHMNPKHINLLKNISKSDVYIKHQILTVCITRYGYENTHSFFVVKEKIKCISRTRFTVKYLRNGLKNSKAGVIKKKLSRICFHRIGSCGAK